MNDEVINEWQQTHAELLGALLAHVENVLKAGSIRENDLYPELRTALNGMAQAYTAFSEHAEATEQSGEGGDAA